MASKPNRTVVAMRARVITLRSRVDATLGPTPHICSVPPSFGDPGKSAGKVQSRILPRRRAKCRTNGNIGRDSVQVKKMSRNLPRILPLKSASSTLFRAIVTVAPSLLGVACRVASSRLENRRQTVAAPTKSEFLQSGLSFLQRSGQSGLPASELNPDLTADGRGWFADNRR